MGLGRGSTLEDSISVVSSTPANVVLGSLTVPGKWGAAMASMLCCEDCGSKCPCRSGERGRSGVPWPRAVVEGSRKVLLVVDLVCLLPGRRLDIAWVGAGAAVGGALKKRWKLWEVVSCCVHL